MAEYIDREAAISLIKKYGNDAIDGGRYSLDTVDACIELANRVKALPTEDVAPVVHGRWIGAPLCGNDNCRCSGCGSWHNIHANLRGEIMQKYCPNCGAKMDGGAESG
nr:MAG TPA: zinc-ribbon domain protein [Caudoviricetes sp.]